jgi:hypothetical protein
MVAASSNHSEGRLAPITLISVAAAAIPAASGERRGRPCGAASMLTGAGVRTWLIGVRCRLRWQ